jgi:hypothetical protein
VIIVYIFDPCAVENLCRVFNTDLSKRGLRQCLLCYIGSKVICVEVSAQFGGDVVLEVKVVIIVFEVFRLNEESSFVPGAAPPKIPTRLV